MKIEKKILQMSNSNVLPVAERDRGDSESRDDSVDVCDHCFAAKNFRVCVRGFEQ